MSSTSSLVKYAASKVTTPDGRRLFWDRANQDGVPYRGSFAPMLTEEEYEARTVTVVDFRNAFFDVADAKENAVFGEVIECCCNGWFRMIHLDRFWRGTTKHYVEWLELYKEDGTRTPYSTAGYTEVGGNGLQSLLG